MKSLTGEGCGLPDKTRFIAILATLLGCQGIDEFRAMIPAALNFDVTPVEALCLSVHWEKDFSQGK